MKLHKNFGKMRVKTKAGKTVLFKTVETGKFVSSVKLEGSKTRGWIITVSDNCNFCDDMAITPEEAMMLRDLLVKKVK